jgi:hypothetical protein
MIVERKNLSIYFSLLIVCKEYEKIACCKPQTSATSTAGWGFLA